MSTKLMLLFISLCLPFNLLAQNSDSNTNAFLIADDALERSNALVEASNEMLAVTLREHLSKKKIFQNPKKVTKEEMKVYEAFDKFERLLRMINNTRENLIEESGGMDELGYPVGRVNMEIPKALIFEENFGRRIEESIKETKAAFEGLIDDKSREKIFELFPMKPTTKLNGFQKWADYTFKDLNVASTLVVLNKIKNDALAANQQFLLKLWDKYEVNGYKSITPYNYQLIAEKSAGYISQGGNFKSDIYLARNLTNIEKIEFLTPEEGKISKIGDLDRYIVKATTLGKKRYTIKCVITNEMLETRDTIENDFYYTVGTQENLIHMKPIKSDVLYKGVRHIFKILTAGVDLESMQLKSENCEIIRNTGFKNSYQIIPNELGAAKITVSANNLAPTEFEFRVKSVPNPVPYISGVENGEISLKQFMSQNRLGVRLRDFDYEANCVVRFFVMTKISGGKVVGTIESNKNQIPMDGRQMMREALIDDIFIFDKIKCQCPGDVDNRQITDMVLRMK